MVHNIVHKTYFVLYYQDGSVYEVFPRIRGSQEVEIYDSITVTPPVLFFPWDPVSRCSHEYKIQVIFSVIPYLQFNIPSQSLQS